MKKNRQIVLDTETTGLDAKKGHRIIEIGCVEIIDREITDAYYHQYINPQREIDEGAAAVHGITSHFLNDKPLFDKITDKFLPFIKNAGLVIHNAAFDLSFLNAEFSLLGQNFAKISAYSAIIDTLEMARKKHPGQKNNLDALCKRYKIDNSNRELHGALLDAKLLAMVYLAMTGGQSSFFDIGETKNAPNKNLVIDTNAAAKVNKQAALQSTVVIMASPEEIALHQQKLNEIQQKSGGICLWKEN